MLNSHNGYNVHKGEKILACAESVVSCVDVARGLNASRLLFLLPRILAASDESNYRNVMRIFSDADSICH